MIIENHNVNVVVHLNSKEVAEELWKVIQTHLDNDIGYFNSRNVIKDLERVVMPVVSSSRRSVMPQSIVQVANKFDKITRRVLTRDAPTMNAIDEEIKTRDIVADMMASLKMILLRKIQDRIEETENKEFEGRRMHGPVTTDNVKRDDYVDVRIKIHREDIINMLH